MIKIAFSGCYGVGKDYVAKQANLKILGFADAIYPFAEYFFGTSDKSVPGIRKFLQQVGQYGRGHYSEQYPACMERAIAVDTLRNVGPVAVGSHPLFIGQKIDWSRFGRDSAFWINILLGRKELTQEDSNHAGVAITNARFHNEIDALTRHGFEHVHVMATIETRKSRLGTGWNDDTAQDVSEKMAQELDDLCRNADHDVTSRGIPLKVVWNDDPESPARPFYTWCNNQPSSWLAARIA